MTYTSEIKESTEAFPLLGYTVIASLDSRAEIDRDRLLQLTTPLGFGGFTPPQVEPATYIQRGIAAWLRELKNGQIPAGMIDEEGKSLIRQIKTPDKTVLIFALVKERIDLAALGLSYLTNLRIFYVKPRKAEGKEPGPGTLMLTLTPSGATNPRTYQPDAREAGLLAGLQKWVDFYERTYKSGELSRMTNEIIESLSATKMRLAGGVHFVPYSRRDDLARLKQLIEVDLPTVAGLPSTSTLMHLPVVDEANSRAQVSGSAHDSFMQKIEAYEDNMRRFLEAHATAPGKKPKVLKKTYMAERLGQYEEVKAELELYAALLGERRRVLEAKVALLEEQALALIGIYGASTVAEAEPVTA